MEANRKRAKVHRLPTENEGVIISDVGPYDTDMIPTSEVPKELRSHDRPHNHLYFTTDEEIKEGDWHLHFYEGKGIISQSFNRGVKVVNDEKEYYKIIATTDPELKVDTSKEYNADSCKVIKSLPQPSQDFIKAYCKAGGIDEVLVEYDEKYSTLYFPDGVSIQPNSSIIIHPVEEKMYSENEIADLVIKLGSSWQSHNNFNAVDFHGERVELMKEWIKENL